jgi:hypothetical protein
MDMERELVNDAVVHAPGAPFAPISAERTLKLYALRIGSVTTINSPALPFFMTRICGTGTGFIVPPFG